MLSAARPVGLRTAPAAGQWWRIDATEPAAWSWAGFPTARHRFDPTSGRFRVRYGANRPVAAACERFPERTITTADGGHFLVVLTGSPPAVHLTHQHNLDALELDDRISTGRIDQTWPQADPLLQMCQNLADAVHDWWAPQPAPALCYRTRSVPSARSLAFSVRTEWHGQTARPLREATDLLADLVVHHDFTVPEHWLI